jgi:hypothetical protein
VRLTQLALALVSAVVVVVAVGSFGGLDTVEVTTMALVISGAMVVQFLRQPRLRGE